MIEKIGIVYQDITSKGFLIGLKIRLDCNAELIDPPTSIGKQRQLRPRDAKLVWRYFQKKGVNLVVRFTDADGHGWQSTKQEDIKRIPDEARATWVCGVATENVEDWLSIDTSYISQELTIDDRELDDDLKRTGRIKNAITKACASQQLEKSELVANLVAKAPKAVFRKWLTNPSLRKFYGECRSAASKADCSTPNELEK